MKRWNVIVELPAQRDIAECRLWIAEQNAEAANQWFYDIYDTIGTLEIFPERCPLAPESRFLNCEIREIFHGRANINIGFFSPSPKMKFTSCTSATAHDWLWAKPFPKHKCERIRSIPPGRNQIVTFL